MTQATSFSTDASPKTAEGTPDAEIVAVCDTLRASFESGATRSYEWRVQQLRQFMRMVEENEDAMVEALRQDLRKPYFEGWSAEPQFLKAELALTMKKLKSWMKPRRVSASMAVQPARGRIVPEPLGVALIIGAWNYPIQLSLAPLIGAIAAGNCAVIKPSELAPASSALQKRLIEKYLDRDCVRVVEGGVKETSLLLEQRWDHIFYTGGGAVGKIVMAAASKHLTPVTLELGGKSPCIVDQDVDLETAARRIVWGRFFNAGQTCVAPDYVLVHESLERPLLDALKKVVKEFYGDDPKQSDDYARIINRRHFERLSKLLDSGETVVGGDTDADQCYISPTILRGITGDEPVMADEIFGPILPVIKVSNLDQAIRFVNQRPKPLALYVFTRDKQNADRVVERTSSGGVCINDVISHMLPPDLPFGGVGASGMGAYHGKGSFNTFSHMKSVLDKPTFVDPALRYPPYTEEKMKWVKRLL
ncbi:MAG: aldehyde dehydrogenase family protein [Myxococcales bacterium]|nr:aldehyde dehydrogenase family protein [Myxococcales bacterium]